MVHWVAGYDKETELLAVERDILTEQVARVREIARVGPDDPDATGSYPLDRHQVKRIARLLGAKFNTDRYDFFLEPSAEQL